MTHRVRYATRKSSKAERITILNTERNFIRRQNAGTCLANRLPPDKKRSQPVYGLQIEVQLSSPYQPHPSVVAPQPTRLVHPKSPIPHHQTQSHVGGFRRTPDESGVASPGQTEFTVLLRCESEGDCLWIPLLINMAKISSLEKISNARGLRLSKAFVSSFLTSTLLIAKSNVRGVRYFRESAMNSFWFLVRFDRARW